MKVYSANKRVAILLATYNGELYIREFLDSLCKQSYQDFCLYVRDDGSTDSTLSIVGEFSDRLTIEILPAEGRLGPARNFLKILELAGDKYDHYLFADQDDYWYSDKVERTVRALQGHEEEVLLYCTRYEYVDERLRHLKYSRIPHVIGMKNAIVQNIAAGCTIGITRRVREEILAGHPHNFFMHDWLLYMYCSAFGKIVFDAQPSIKYRQHGSNNSGAATTLVDFFRKRWTQFIKRGAWEYVLSRQILAFMDCYGEALNEKDRHLFRIILCGKKHFFTRLRLVFFPPVVRQTFLDTLFMRFVFLTGRY